MNRSAAALLGLLLFSPSAHADSLSLSDVLARYRTATAPAAGHPSAPACRVVTEEETGGLKGTTVTITEGDEEWSEAKLGPLDDIDGTDGSVFWHQDSNGNVRLLSTEERKDESSAVAVSSHAFAESSGFQGKVTLRLEREKKSGCYVLDVAPDDGNPMTLYIDPQTFLLVKKERMADDRLSTTTYSDFKMLGGRMRAATIRTHEGSKKYDEISTILSVEDVPAPEASLFALPIPVKNYTWTTPGVKSAVLPFSDADDSIALYVAINGQPAYLELDSGSSGIGISQVAARKLNLAHQGVLEGRGYGGSVDEAPIKMDTLELVGGVIFRNVSATSLPLFEDYAFYDAVPYVGLVGYDLLSRFVVRVDYAAGLLTLTDPDAFTPSASDGTPLPMELDDNVPSVLASFDGLPPARFLVDTGDGGAAVRLYVPFVQDNKLAEKYSKGRDILNVGVGGESKARQIRAPSFSVAGITLSNVPTSMSLDKNGATSRKMAGALGHDFLSHFTVTFDYPHKRLFFAPGVGIKKPFDTRTFGVYVLEAPDLQVASNTRLVLFADEKSPALDAGLSEGDALVKIDGQNAMDLGIGEVRRLLSPAGGKDTHVLSIIGREGGTGNVTVRMYDPLPPQKDK